LINNPMFSWAILYSFRQTSSLLNQQPTKRKRTERVPENEYLYDNESGGTSRSFRYNTEESSGTSSNQDTDTFRALASAATSKSNTGLRPFSILDSPDWSIVKPSNCSRATRSNWVTRGFADFLAWRTRPPTMFLFSTGQIILNIRYRNIPMEHILC
jgi:hypothetical protein